MSSPFTWPSATFAWSWPLSPSFQGLLLINSDLGAKIKSKTHAAIATTIARPFHRTTFGVDACSLGRRGTCKEFVVDFVEATPLKGGCGCSHAAKGGAACAGAPGPIPWV